VGVEAGLPYVLESSGDLRDWRERLRFTSSAPQEDLELEARTDRDFFRLRHP
jgi:hypothetical protein